MGQVTAEICVLPLGTNETSLSGYVAATQAVLQQYPEVNSQLTPMATILEGEWARVLEVIQKMHQAPLNQGAQRVSTSIRIDERRDKVSSLAQKVTSVMNQF